MGIFLKWGNWFVAKLVEVLFGTTHLSDVGCTLRLMSRRAYTKIRGQITVMSSELNPELLMLYIRNDIRFVEIPIHYGERVGQSAVTGNFWKTFRLGVIMIALVLRYRIGWLPKKVV